MRETIVLPERCVALDDRGVPLGQRRGRQRRLELIPKALLADLHGDFRIAAGLI